MTVFLLIALLVDALMLWGLIRSHKQRRLDWRHYASFVGFIAGVAAVTDTTLILLVAAPHAPSPTISGFLFVMSIIAMITITATIVAGLCSSGMHRLSLISCGLVTALTFLLGMVGHFGD